MSTIVPPGVAPDGAPVLGLDVARVRGVARLLATLHDSSGAAAFATQVCARACQLLAVDAAALFDDAEPPEPVAYAGAIADMCARTLSADPERLRSWAAGAGFARVELAPLGRDGRSSGGMLALFSFAGAPLADMELETLGHGLTLALERQRTADRLGRAYHQQDREQEQLVRAERLRALGDMARGIAHDFNNILNAILGQTGVLAVLVGDRPDAVAALERLRAVALDGAATIRRVQEFSGQRHDRDFELVDLGALVVRAAADLRARVPDGVRVDVQIGAPPSVHGNAAELEELLRALVDNAHEALADGGAIVLELTSTADDVALTVADSGIGMPEGSQRHAFDPFFTTKGSRAKGLGLAMAYGIARRHGGFIELDSAVGRGTRVRVRLPVARALDPLASVAAAAEAGHAATAAPSSGRRVLLVEDDADNREAMTALLSLGRYEVTAADCGSAALRAFAPGRFDVVLTDLGLPDMDGWQVAAELKRLSSVTPIALVTGWGLHLDGDEILRRGVDLLIPKPLDPRKFLRQIENLLQVGARKPSA